MTVFGEQKIYYYAVSGGSVPRLIIIGTWITQWLYGEYGEEGRFKIW